MSLESILSTFGISADDAIGLATDPNFHHKTKSREELQGSFDDIACVYGCSQKEIIDCILKFPQFAGLNHQRVIRQKCRLGRLIGMSDNEVLELILSRPVFTSYSAKRYLVGLDVCRTLASEGFEPNNIQRAYFNYITKSPYVPGHKRKRISQIEGYNEPPLMVMMRAALQRNSA